MALGAGTGRLKGADLRVGNVALVVRAVDVFAVPTGGKCDGCSDPAAAEALWECYGV
jgi:hypothetical protein